MFGRVVVRNPQIPRVHTQQLRLSKLLFISLLISFVWLFLRATPTSAAACTPPGIDYGSVTSTVNAPTNGTYRVWSRIMAPDTTNNSYLLEVDGNTCFVVGDNAITANTWTWVDHQNGNTSSKIDVNLTAGSHTIKMIGREPNVGLDRVIFVVDTDCTPTGDGDNCASDTEAPTVSLSAPSPGATLSGTATISANANDDIGVQRVEFYDGGTLLNSDSSSPYSYSWNTTTVSAGSHTLTARAYDGAGNMTTSTAVGVTVSNIISSGGPIAVTSQVYTNQSSAASSITSPAISTTGANQLLLAFIASDGPNTASSQSISGVSGGGLTWTLVRRTNAQPGMAEIWKATAPSAANNITVTATRAGPQAVGSITVVAFTGAAGTGATGTGNGATGATTASLTTTTADSWVWGVGSDFNSATARTLGSNQTKVQEYLPSVGDTYWVQRQNTSTETAGTSVALNTTAPTNARWNMSTVEVTPIVTDTTNPTTSITAPTSGASLSGTVNVTANAADNVGVSRVELFIDGVLGATDNATPFSYSWNTTGVTNGNHSLTTRAYDAAGNVTTSSAVTVTVDNSKPIVSITTPTTGTSVKGTTAISAAATDNRAVTKVEFYDGATMLNSDSSSPFSYNWVTTGAASGSHSLTTRAYDAAGNVTTSSAVTVTVDNSVPVVSLTAPANGATVTGTVNLTATASDNIGVTKVEFYRGATLLGFDTTSSYTHSWNTLAIADGSYTLTAKAYDAANNLTTSSIVTVVVDNVVTPPPDTTAPTVSIPSPSNNATVSGTTVISSNASDNVGVSRVEYYVDGNLVGTDSGAPFAYSWNTGTVADGSHNLTARAYDAANNSTLSSPPVTVNVVNAPVLKPGDVNSDGSVTLLDLSILLTNYIRNNAARNQGDLSGDGTVNLLDLSILLTNYGT